MQRIGEILTDRKTCLVPRITSAPPPSKPTETPSPETPTCPRCKGAGWVIERGKVVSCKCQEAQLREVRLRQSGLLPYKDMTFGTFKPRPGVKNLVLALAGARAVARGASSMLTLLGPCGTGKTHLAAAIGWEWLNQGEVVIMTTVTAMLDRWRHTFDFTPQQAFELHEPSFATLFNAYCLVPHLILDDLGVQQSTSWIDEKLDSLIDYRWLNNLPTVVTTNEIKLPTRQADRLGDTKWGKMIVLSGESQRAKRS